jgi:3'-5' exoribonuclease
VAFRENGGWESPAFLRAQPGDPWLKISMPDPARKTIAQIRTEARAGTIAARLHAQVEDVVRKEDRNAKPYYELRLRDGSDSLSLKGWNSSPNFNACAELEKGDTVQVEGEFGISAFGLEAQRWTMRPLLPAEAQDLFDGDESTRAANDADFEMVTSLVESLVDPRLKALSLAFLDEFGLRFRRAAAARHNHHAFRGGLLRHTAQMMRSADCICVAYPMLNRDLILTGVLFHDSGKLWEMCPPENGFDIPRELRGELLGHISIGIEVANALWRKLPLEEWKGLTPSSEDVRLHLLHLIASHHGELEYGSPVEPKTPEAIALHYIDNLDARLEMIFNAYAKQPEVAPGIFERVRPLNTMPVRALPPFAGTPADADSTR